MRPKQRQEVPDTTDKQLREISEVPPKHSPKNAAGSENPQEKNAFYEEAARKAAGKDK